MMKQVLFPTANRAAFTLLARRTAATATTTAAPTAFVPPKSWSLSSQPHSESEWWSQNLSFASPESDFSSSNNTATSNSHAVSLPHTLAQALQSSQACVVTTKAHPHTIVAVNAAWESLCGYRQDEVLHQTLAVIQGPQTNTELAEASVNAVVQNNKDTHTTNDVYLINYKKSGESFINHLTLSNMVLSLEQPQVELLVGVLEPVRHVPLRLVV